MTEKNGGRPYRNIDISCREKKTLDSQERKNREETATENVEQIASDGKRGSQS